MNNWHLFCVGMATLDIGLGMVSLPLPFIVTGIVIVLSVTVVSFLDYANWSKHKKEKDELNRRS